MNPAASQGKTVIDRWFIQSPANYSLKVPAAFPNSFHGQLLRWLYVTNHLAQQVFIPELTVLFLKDTVPVERKIMCAVELGTFSNMQPFYFKPVM